MNPTTVRPIVICDSTCRGINRNETLCTQEQSQSDCKSKYDPWRLSFHINHLLSLIILGEARIHFNYHLKTTIVISSFYPSITPPQSNGIICK